MLYIGKLEEKLKNDTVMQRGTFGGRPLYYNFFKEAPSGNKYGVFSYFRGF